MTRVEETRKEDRKESHPRITFWKRSRDKSKEQEMPPKNTYATYQQVKISSAVPSTGQVHTVKAHQPKDKSELTPNKRGAQILENDEAKIRNLEQEVPYIECGNRNTEVPSETEKQKKRREFGFSADTTHIAVVGTVGTEPKKFVDLFSQCPSKGTEKIEWHAFPEAGSESTTLVDYFHNQGLYAYNVIIILMRDRVTDLDCSIASMSHRCGIPFICIRLKSDFLIDWREVPINERAKLMAEMRADISANLRQTLVKEMKILNQDFSFFLINLRALKRRIQNKPNTSDIIECDEEALLDHLQKQFALCIASGHQSSTATDAERSIQQQLNREYPYPKVDLTPSPNVTINYQQADSRHSYPKGDRPKVAFIGSSGLCEALTEAKDNAGHEWSSLKNVRWLQLPPMKSDQTFAKYLESSTLSSYQAVIILVGPWISYPEICTAKHCEDKEIPYVFLRVDDKCCPSCQGCATGSNPPLQHPLGFDHAEEWTSSFVPKSFPELRAPGPVFWVTRFALIDEFCGGKSGSEQAAKLLTRIRDLVENKFGPSPTPPISETERVNATSGLWTRTRTLVGHNGLTRHY